MMVSLRKVLVVTGTRAEYGLLRPLMRKIKNSSQLELQLVATGTHLSKAFGFTLKDIESDGFIVDKKLDIVLNSDTPVGISKSMGLIHIGFSEILNELDPDILLIVGDRYEIFSVASCAMIAGIPIAHCHGGELTEGAFDDSIRHSISKMSHIHFCSTDKSRNRIIQLGEQPSSVHVVGPLAISSINETELLDLDQLQNSLNLTWRARNILVTFHPETLQIDSTVDNLYALLDALDTLSSTNIIFTLSNADTYGQTFNSIIREFCSCRDNAYAFSSLGQSRYYSCISFCDAVVGNSSSGILEAPLFNKPSLNIGNRQKGRECGPSVVNCNSDYNSIVNGLHEVVSSKAVPKVLAFEARKSLSVDPSVIIVNKLIGIDLSELLNKRFYEFPLPP